jgi:prepilin-type processing-associated H-X9-DG protein
VREAAALPLGDRAAGFFGHERLITLADITDGSSCTLAVVETSWRNGPWAAGGFPTVRGIEPGDEPYVGDGRPFRMKHRQDSFFRTNPFLANVAFVDGSVRSLEESVGPEVWRAMATIGGGEEVGEEQ